FLILPEVENIIKNTWVPDKGTYLTKFKKISIPVTNRVKLPIIFNFLRVFMRMMKMILKDRESDKQTVNVQELMACRVGVFRYTYYMAIMFEFSLLALEQRQEQQLELQQVVPHKLELLLEHELVLYRKFEILIRFIELMKYFYTASFRTDYNKK
ncbi:hypothetical protein BpHYR1_030704, partial [Brachionus plicatilis]